MEKKFNIRVYGILIQEDRILLARENYHNKRMIKFVGGGMEWGEGLADALKREFMEEWQLPIAVEELIYTNDFFQQSAFNAQDQLISIYYRIASLDNTLLDSHITNSEGKAEGIFWKNLREIESDFLTWPIDRIVLERLKTS